MSESSSLTPETKAPLAMATASTPPEPDPNTTAVGLLAQVVVIAGHSAHRS